MRANPPGCRRRALTLAWPAALATHAQANKRSILRSEGLPHKNQFHARIFGLSLAAVFGLCLILNAVHWSNGRGCPDHLAGLGTISSDLALFAQAPTAFAVESASYFRRSANESLPECAARSARGEEPGY